LELPKRETSGDLFELPADHLKDLTPLHVEESGDVLKDEAVRVDRLDHRFVLTEEPISVVIHRSAISGSREALARRPAQHKERRLRMAFLSLLRDGRD